MLDNQSLQQGGQTGDQGQAQGQQAQGQQGQTQDPVNPVTPPNPAGGFDPLAGLVPPATTQTPEAPQVVPEVAFPEAVQAPVTEPVTEPQHTQPEFQSFGQDIGVTSTPEVAAPVATVPVVEPPINVPEIMNPEPAMPAIETPTPEPEAIAEIIPEAMQMQEPAIPRQNIEETTPDTSSEDTSEATNDDNDYIAYEEPMGDDQTGESGVDKVFEQYKEMIRGLERTVENMEMDIKKIKSTLNQMQDFDPHNPPKTNNQNRIEITEDNVEEVIEGEFDGVTMIGINQKKYPVPTNYASKSKLVPGDKMKLRIMKDGRMIYKLVEPVERETIKTIISKDEQSDKFIAIHENQNTFFLNQAAVTYHKGRPGDEAYIIVNKANPGNYGAIEAIVKK